MKIPNRASDFTVSWLNEALAANSKYSGKKVVKCRARDSDIPGQTAEIVLLEVDFDSSDPNLPRSIVAKVTSRNPIVLKEVINHFDQYRRETSFYLEFPDIGIPVPECLYAFHDASTQQMVLLMRDLAPATSPSWAISLDQVELAASVLPAFHAKWWNDPHLKTRDWLVQPDDMAFYTSAFEGAAGASETLSKLYRAPELTQEIMAELAARTKKVVKFIQSRPFTFVHGDYHAKQMFFPVSEGGQFAVIDWQFPFVAPGPWDLARLTAMGMSTSDRQQHGERIQSEYHQALVTAGVTKYSHNEYATDYRFGLVISQVIMAIAAASTDPKLFQDECDALGVDWRDMTFDRTQRALEEMDVLSLVKQI